MLGIKVYGVLFLVLMMQVWAYAEKTVITDYGVFVVKEPVLIELFDCPAMQRLVKIHQYGVTYFTQQQNYWYSRYEHSVGVWALLKRFGASLEEQIAGLLHDVSHTVFSHVGDLVFKRENAYYGSSYQDDIHEWYFYESGISKILERHGISLALILSKNEHLMLEQDLPDICADRLEYNLKGGLLEGLITSDQKDAILEDICFFDGKWVFQTPRLAVLFAEISLYHTQFVWGSADQALVYSWAAQALQRAVEIGLITLHDLHFSTDEVMWQLLTSSADKIIQGNIDKMIHDHAQFVFVERTEADFFVKTKFRGIDPLVKQVKGVCRLTGIDADYAHQYHQLKKLIEAGWALKMVSEIQ